MNDEDAYRRSIDDPIGFWAEPARAIHWHAPPRAIQALAQQADPGDLSTLDDPGALVEVRRALGRPPAWSG
jgi:propionyl-CoA synthetase